MYSSLISIAVKSMYILYSVASYAAHLTKVVYNKSKNYLLWKYLGEMFHFEWNNGDTIPNLNQIVKYLKKN